MDHHLSCESPGGNSRSGYGKWTALTDSGTLGRSIRGGPSIELRSAASDEVPVPFPGLVDKIVSMYPTSVSTREIAGHIQESYGVDICADPISAVTVEVPEQVSEWQSRLPQAVSPLVFFGALRVIIPGEGQAPNNAVHLALGVRGDGEREIQGLWIETNEGDGILASGDERTQEPRHR